jgi:hypothetical protein
MADYREYSMPKVEDYNTFRPYDVSYRVSFKTSDEVIDNKQGDPAWGSALYALIDKLVLDIMPLLKKFRFNATGIREAQKYKVTTETETEYYKNDDINPSKIEKGLSKQVKHTTTYEDAYLDVLFEFFGILGMTPLGYGDISNLKHYHYQTYNYFVKPPTALPQQMMEYKYRLVCKCPNFDMNITSGQETSAKWKYYDLLSADSNTMTLLINILTGWLLGNYTVAVLSGLVFLLTGKDWIDELRPAFAKYGFDDDLAQADTLYEKTMRLRQFSDVMMHVGAALHRAINTNLGMKQVAYFKKSSAELEAMREDCLPLLIAIPRGDAFRQALREDPSTNILIMYNLMSFDHTTFTPSGIVSTVKKMSYRLDQSGNLERFHSHPEVVPTESLYKMLSPISRQIVIKDGVIKKATVYLKDEQVRIGEIEFSDNDDPEESDFMDTTEQYVQVGLQTSNWDDAIAVSKIIPDELRRIDVSYKFVGGSAHDVVNDFISALSDHRIIQMSVSYDNLPGFGSCDYTFFTT